MAERAVRREDLVRFRLPSFRRKLDNAQRVIGDALAKARRPYVAWSGGKDSLAVLALVARQSPGVVANWSDDELEYPDQPSYVPATAAALGATVLITAGWATHAGWFRPWRDPPFWRDQLPGTIHVGERIETWMPRQGYDGVFVGLRSAEAAHRRQYLRACGRLYQTRSRGWACNPLAWWTVDDVWALIAGWELPYNPTYDRLAELGLPREKQRVGPLPLSDGWVLKGGWPAMYERLIARYGRMWTA